jgi:putative cardiolipin synthase
MHNAAPAGSHSWLSRLWSGLPDNAGRSVSRVMPGGAATSLGRTHQPLLAGHPGASGVRLLAHGRDALVARAVLAQRAELTIDVQYYMYHQDTVGRLLLVDLLAAADRGVRVRLLIDDIYGAEGDSVWAALAVHPAVEVRLFNPFARGRPKPLQFVTRLLTLNHRMHSKSFTVDDQATIVGGRNIGSEYFDADPDLAFTDLDALAIGPVVQEVSAEFDAYWNSRHAYPIGTLRRAARPADLDALRKDLASVRGQPAAATYLEALNTSDLARALRDHTASFGWSQAMIIHDSPEKQTLGEEGGRRELLMSRLAPYLLAAKQDVIIVSPYFVPGRRAVQAMCRLRTQGVRIRILTNSLASNDVAAVHAGYSKYRTPLLQGGVELYELDEQVRTTEAKLFTWLPGLSKSSLHAKTMAVDHRDMFVGSFNFDQRSLFLNNEIGIVFRAPAIASQAFATFDAHIDRVAFRVTLQKGLRGAGSLRWIKHRNGAEVVLTHEPYASWWSRLMVAFLRLLPLDSML